jgi:hypothetical protein
LRFLPARRIRIGVGGARRVERAQTALDRLPRITEMEAFLLPRLRLAERDH